MAKLKKRELIILGIMGVTVLIGAYIVFMPGGAKLDTAAPGKKMENMESVLTILNADVGGNKAKDASDYIFASAQRGWTKDPFWESSSYKRWLQSTKPVSEKSAATAKMEFVYTGFLEIGKRRLAIVNDIEYQEGERLEIKGYVLRSVTPAKILIENTATGVQQSVLLRDDANTN